MNNEPIALTTLIARTDQILANTLDEETVLLSIPNSQYYGMKSVAARIWELIATPTTVSDIIKVLLEEYAVPENECALDVLSFLAALRQEGLIDCR